MDQRMIDAMDPTSYGGDIIRTEGDDLENQEEERIEDSIDDEIEVKGKEGKQHMPLTIFTEDVEWGDRGHGQAVLL